MKDCSSNCRCGDCACAERAAFFDALSSPTRWKILQFLERGPKNVSQIAAGTKLEQTCVSHCLRKLQTQKLITRVAKGRYRVYALNEKTIAPMLTILARHR